MKPAYGVSVIVFSAMVLASALWATERSHERAEGPVKSLPQDNVEALLRGDGMGLAKAAELNHYPGPRHVLDLAGPLGLSEAQRESTQAIFDQMHAQAMVLGRQLVEAERALDQQFASKQVSEATLDKQLSEIGRINAALRAVHLKAHLSQQRVLNAEQLRQYDELRGYAHGGPSMHHGH